MTRCLFRYGGGSRAAPSRSIANFKEFDLNNYFLQGDYPHDFTGVNTNTCKGMDALKSYIDAVPDLPLGRNGKDQMYGVTAALLEALRCAIG